MARALSPPAAVGDWVAGPTLGRRLQHVLCILVVASAIKTPLDIPLYWNAGMLLLGLFALMVVQSLQPIFLWVLALLAVGAAGAVLAGSIPTSVPRLAQVFLFMMAASLVARLDPRLIVRYLPLLLPLMVLIVVAETLLPEPLYHPRSFLGIQVARHGGLQGEPNYNAALHGVVAVLLAQQPPRVLALLPLLVALPTLSRGLILGLAAWGGSLLIRHRLARLGPWLVLLLCLQPLLVLALDLVISEGGRDLLIRASSQRFAVWVAYAKMGFAHPFGVGYFEGTTAMLDYEQYLGADYRGHQAHSMFLQVFGEFGWLGYLPFAAFLLHLACVVGRHAPERMPVLLFVLILFALLNGLSGWEFWVPVGCLLAWVRTGTAPAGR